MDIRLVLRGFGIVLLILSVFLLFPFFTALYYGENVFSFGITALSCFLLGGGLFFFLPKPKDHFSARESFLLVTGTWVLICAIGAIPYILDNCTMGFADAFFESASGFTTTGSTIFADVEILPRSILFWRSMTHWIGGMGIIVLAVAILPILGVSGFQLMRAEAPGPEVERLTPRITHTAKVFWGIYLFFTLLQTILLRISGLSFFDAINHTFATLATGGFSTRNASVAAFNNPGAEWIITIFMVLSGINFSLYYRLVIKDFRRIARDSELKAYLALFIISVSIVALNLLSPGYFPTLTESVKKGAFQVATLMTSTGFTSSDYSLWPELSQSVLLLMLFIGGCVGSTSGGIKMLHVVVLWKVAMNHFKQLVFPRGVFSVQLNKQHLEDRTIMAVTGFVFLYLFIVFLSTLFLSAGGNDLITSLTASLAVIGNIGPGFGKVGPSFNFGYLPDSLKYWLSFVMIMGRLELYTFLVLLHPMFHRH